MAPRKSVRISQKQSQPDYNTEANCRKKQVSTTRKPARKPSLRGSGGAKRGGGGRGVCEGSGERGRANNSCRVSREALGTTSKDITSYMRSVTHVLCTLFSVVLHLGGILVRELSLTAIKIWCHKNYVELLHNIVIISKATLIGNIC